MLFASRRSVVKSEMRGFFRFAQNDNYGWGGGRLGFLKIQVPQLCLAFSKRLLISSQLTVFHQAAR